MYQDVLPERVRVLVLGGGIHGVGLLHDLASRGWRDVFLVEKDQIGAGTSSRSTKLIHGGLRYLRNPSDFGLVYESLHERAVLMKVAPDLIKPIELYLPVLRRGGIPAILLRSGLFLYDLMAGRQRIHRHRRVSLKELKDNIPFLDVNQFSLAYSYWDMQTDDLALVNRVAASAKHLGAGLCEHTQAVKIKADENGWLVDVRQSSGEIHQISARYVFNGLGPWSNHFLEQSKIEPKLAGLNNKGVHLLLKNRGQKTGVFLQSPEDHRMFFVLPWFGYTLVGTTETLHERSPDELSVTKDDVDYLMLRCNRYFSEPITKEDIVANFAGLRWLPLQKGKGLSQISRSDVVSEHHSHQGLMFTLYGGKLTTYRRLSETLGDRICRHFGEFRPSKTCETDAWVNASEIEISLSDAIDRFKQGGIAYTDQQV